METIAVFIFLLLCASFGLVLSRRPKDRAHAQRDASAPSLRKRTAAPPLRRPKQNALDWVLTRDDWVILDVEATGLSDVAEIIEIAVVDPNGAVLMNQRVLPKGRIPSAATNIHGITRDMLRDCPRWTEIDNEVRQCLAGKRVIAYNAAYEQRLLIQTAEKWGLPSIDILGHCAMLAYAEHRGIVGRDGYKWHKLVNACSHEGIKCEGMHGALADAQTTRALVLKMVTDAQARTQRVSEPRHFARA